MISPIQSLGNLVGRVGTSLDSAINDRAIRVAVTGLSRAGKTVFLTSLIVNLLAMRAGRDTLPAFRARLDRDGPNRLRKVRLLPAGAGTTPRFDVAGKLAELSLDQPHWPARTEDLAEISLELEIAPPEGVLHTLRGFAGSPRVTLSLLDYPGEWLLDLPMLPTPFEQWSAETLVLLRQKPREPIARPFLEFLAAIDPAGEADDALLLRGHHLYRDLLLDCRQRLGLRYLQPGRFLCPGPRTEAPFMWFFPLDNAPGTPRSGSMGALLRDRFEAYKKDIRANFFDTHFRAFDRQIVLVDVLGALHAGKAAYEDTERAVADIAAGLANSGGLLGQLTGGWLGSAGIDRAAFVATKADHVPELQRQNLRALLRDMAQPARTHGPAADDAVSYHVAASVVSTTDGWADRVGGLREPVVWGRELGAPDTDRRDAGQRQPSQRDARQQDHVQRERRAYHVGTVPISRPPEGFWSGQYFDLPVFAPPPIDPTGINGIQHMGLDQILADLIGDRL